MFGAGWQGGVWHDIQLLPAWLYQIGRDEKAEVLWFRVAPKVAEICKTLVGDQPNQENSKNYLKEETACEVGNEDTVCADVVLDVVESKDQEVLKEEEEQDG